jgi:hypothetical protein
MSDLEISEEIRRRMHFRRDMRLMGEKVDRRRRRRRRQERALAVATVVLLLLDALVIVLAWTRPGSIGW